MKTRDTENGDSIANSPTPSTPGTISTQQAKPCFTFYSLRYPLYAIIFATAFADDSQTTSEIKDEAPLKYTLVVSLFLAYLIFEKLFTGGGFNKVNKIKLKGEEGMSDELKEQWQGLTPSSKNMISVLTFTATAWVMISNAVQYNYFIRRSIPKQFGFDEALAASDSLHSLWKGLSIGLSIIPVLGLPFSNGTETFETLVEIWSSHKKKYNYPITSKAAWFILGGTAALKEAITEIVLIEALNIQSNGGKYAIAGLSLLVFLEHFSLNGRLTRNSVDKFLSYLANHYPTKQEVTSFVIAAVLSGLNFYCWQQLAFVFLKDIPKKLFDLQIDTDYDWAFRVASWITVGGDLVGNLANFFEVINSALTQLVNRFSEQNTPEQGPLLADHENPEQNPYLITSSSSSFFSAAPEDKPQNLSPNPDATPVFGN